MNKFDKICRRRSFKHVKPEWKQHVKNYVKFQDLCTLMERYERRSPEWRQEEWGQCFLSDFFKYEKKAKRAEEIIGDKQLRAALRIVSSAGYGGSF